MSFYKHKNTRIKYCVIIAKCCLTKYGMMLY